MKPVKVFINSLNLCTFSFMAIIYSNVHLPVVQKYEEDCTYESVLEEVKKSSQQLYNHRTASDSNLLYFEDTNGKRLYPFKNKKGVVVFRYSDDNGNTPVPVSDENELYPTEAGTVFQVHIFTPVGVKDCELQFGEKDQLFKLLGN
ncbi:hypothetical protein COEREDRAFT_89642 [Coemansia reversa NRRL 1564]|uniref:Uncharacterized protein n=1 Tax=Coemansia reversa (strain ATCC 12441 / NRRL 1564) TaxID=763665 RepID=A0A2G5B2X1_COERN|nr:hypothetical protein COEREDRAFT_89642 [Coemansia reversa NRRL 1564]|eukprot:PIA13363.1 hypothetical protein COEREDRAFT_89642 [Coemansia reversa NRRL 1564]